MIKRFQPLSQFLVVLVASGWMQQAVAQIVNEQAVYQESAIYTPPPPTDISYKFVLNPGVHKNRWSRHQVAVTLFGTKGQFRKHLTKDSIVPYYWNYYDSGNLFDFSKDRSINHEKCTSAMQRAPTEDQPG